MSEMRDRIAHAIHEQVEPWDRFEIDQREWYKAADAVLIAIKGPTPDMVDAALLAYHGAMPDADTARDWRAFMTEAYNAAIDAALK